MAQETWEMEEPQYEIHPEGTFVGTITGFTNEGEKDGQYGPYISAWFDVQTQEVREDGELFFPLRAWVNKNAGPESKTTKLRNAVAGRTLTKEERLGTFEPNSLIGKPVMIQVVHNTKGDKTHPNIDSVMALPKGHSTPPPAATATGAQQQSQRWQGQGQRESAQPSDDHDDDLPFG